MVDSVSTTRCGPPQRVVVQISTAGYILPILHNANPPDELTHEKISGRVHWDVFSGPCGTGAVAANHLPASEGAVTHVGVSLCFGLIVAVLIYAIGPVSGCHINPAVTIALHFAGKFKTSDVGPYILAQCLGAIAASATVKFAYAPVTAIGATTPSTTALASFVLEFLMTALLLFVVMQVADGSQLAGITAGGVIGSVIAFEALFGGPLSGASMNPARSLGPALVAGVWTDHWVYWAGPILGGIAGILLHWALQPDKKS